jgi:hypothetical protein
LAKFSVEFEAPAAWVQDKKAHPESLGTEHLPLEVTRQPVTAAVWSTTEEINAESGRPRGWFAISLNIAGRENPDELSADEREYVACLFEEGARRIRKGSV